MRGKAALRHYWTTALTMLPDLHFDVIGVYQGESTLVINYRNHRGELVNEVLMFDGDLVREGHGTYLASHGSPPLTGGGGGLYASKSARCRDLSQPR